MKATFCLVFSGILQDSGEGRHRATFSICLIFNAGANGSISKSRWTRTGHRLRFYV